MNHKEKLHIGFAKEEINTPLEVGYLTSSVRGTYASFEKKLSPLFARVIAFQSSEETIILISLDLIGLSNEAVFGWERFKKAIGKHVDSNKIIVTCTHNHSSPESISLSSLSETEIYSKWLIELENTINKAILESLKNLEQISRIKRRIGILKKHSLQRRIKTEEGIRMSDCMQPIEEYLFDIQPIDNRNQTIEFLNQSGKTIASIAHVICHPVHEMLHPFISPDFTGYLAEEMNHKKIFGFSLVVNGCCADINPPTVSGGTNTAKKHAYAILNCFLNPHSILDVPFNSINYRRKNIRISHRSNTSVLETSINYMKIGELGITFLPGEIFIATAQKIEQYSPKIHHIIVGFSENYIGYTPTKQAFIEGGYEVGPGKWSNLHIDTENILIDESKRLHDLERIFNN